MAKKRRRRRRLKKGPVIVLFIVVLLLISSVIYIYTHTSKYLFFKGLNKTYSYIENLSFIDTYMPYLESNYYNKTSSSFSVKTSELDTNITFKGDIYFKDKSNYYDLDINANGVNYGLELFNRDERLYYKIDDSKYYYTNYSDVNGFSIDGYYDLLSLLIGNLKSGEFKKKDVELTINTKKYNTKKIMLILTDEEFKNMMNEFHNDVIKDERLSYVYMSLIGFSTKEELIDYIDNYDIKFDQEVITYSIYLYKNKPIMNEIENGIDGNDRIGIITMDNYFEVRYTTLEDDMSYLKIYDNTIDMFLDGIGYGKGKYTDNSFEIEFTDYDDKSLGQISYLIDKKNSEKFIVNILIDINLSEISYKVDSINEIVLNKDIPKKDTTNSIAIDNIPENDKKTLSELLSIINLIFAF